MSQHSYSISNLVKSHKDKKSQLQQWRELRTISTSKDIQVVVNDRQLINFSSNDYLGLSQHPALKQSAIDFISEYGVGASASRLICGNREYHENVENQIARMKGFESALLFNTGYQANATILQAITTKKSLILADKYIHNSLLQGVLCSKAKLIRYQHGDLNHLQDLLKSNSSSHCIVITESIFSMDGDKTDMQTLVKLAKRYKAFLYVDEAHATGLFGTNGMGLAEGLADIDIVMGTFGKALGGFGAYVACSQSLRHHLINACPGFIYTTALPPSVVGAIQASLNLLPMLEKNRVDLQTKAHHLRLNLIALGYDVGYSSTHIIPIIVGAESKALSLAKWLEEKGLLVIPIRPPTVPQGKSRIKISLSSQHTSEHLDYLLKCLHEFKNQINDA